MNNSQNPVARENGLVIQETGDEVLVYDVNSNKAHCLNKTAAFVWKSCNGKNTVENITGLAEKEFSQKVEEDLIWLALDQLSKESLLETPIKSKIAGLSRRDVIKRIGFAAAVSLPVVAMLSFPNNALAVTCAGSFCGSNDPASGCAGQFCCRSGMTFTCQATPCPTSGPNVC
jgi:hypothetical protein